MEARAYLKPEDCKVGWLYEIDARNGSVGICEIVDGRMHFRLSRFKFGTNFLFSELHWDLDSGHTITTIKGENKPLLGSAKPLRAIELAPTFATDAEEMAYMNEWETKLEDSINERT